ncbi:CRISPR-associated protein Csx20 [Thermoanaerobacterium sp. RBIITD]|uniref:CRISPR-associated protein Csx20 n=1 Tax=Thermoanaerobacterium sp. RBIITD TaxID=1550240 RepID=UPI000BBFC9A1|nr:CRISPR-associated protein Csx20 [Thermoanaerobacterium sp. RBIITD]SNX53615.1 hypothetical protein SAMN05660242_1171 [Thermoanaerobacterium sp. RBIITD]
MTKKKMLLIFSHQLTDGQKDDAIKSLGIGGFLYMPANLQQKWSQVPSETISLKDYLKDIFDWILLNSVKDDYVLVQGDFGATYITVDFCLLNSRIPIYAAAKRDIAEEYNDDGKIIIKRAFSHDRFKKYERYV